MQHSILSRVAASGRSAIGAANTITRSAIRHARQPAARGAMAAELMRNGWQHEHLVGADFVESVFVGAGRPATLPKIDQIPLNCSA